MSLRLSLSAQYLCTFVMTLCLFSALATPASARTLSSGQAEQVRKAFSLVEGRKWSAALSAAQRTGNNDAISAVTWHYLTRSKELPSFGELANFIRSHGHYPKQEKLQIRAEQALMHGNADDRTIQQWLSSHAPKTEWAKLKYEELRGRVGTDRIKQAWMNGDFSKAEERRISAAYSSTITADDHAKRANRLLWEGSTKAAERVLSKLSASQAKLVRARLALQRRQSNGLTAKINAVPKSLKGDKGLLFDRMAYRARAKNYAGVQEILLDLDGRELPYAKKWWPHTARAARNALERGNYSLAEALLDRHGQTKDNAFQMSEALWLEGWTALNYRKKPSKAFTAFKGLFNVVKYPISKSRGAYWAGRAAKDAGNDREAQRWFRTAAEYPTTFYGQLGHEEVYSRRALSLPSTPHFSRSDFSRFASQNPVARMIVTLGEADIEGPLWPFLKHLVAVSDSKKEAAMVAYRGTSIGRADLALRASKQAGQKGIFLPNTSYPLVNVPKKMAVEPELAYAIMRQESSFYPRARSHAGARGLMQLMPATARITAKKIGVSYSLGRLYDEVYNIRLGSTYLGGLVDRFSGNYIMAIAGYNAGPGRSIKWSASQGRPGKTSYQAIRWIESIPFSETRNYVQRVLENYQVYRSILSGGDLRSNAYENLQR